ncbi:MULTISPECIES: MarP family serine protease [Glycomyces]|uniref:MarP family serine protease n=2 Tax=Glycomyces TaxID=58113 RepID=A0A9X3SW57_9ACTN|nr:MarP family serine protease [Glycomyces lechevalierae]MDA1385487.1 MarP family serine protease [Glycomyces lechevalierae]MDR7339676.1 S1-C subfamily serine protease [Glycomyces lechevalierae]
MEPTSAGLLVDVVIVLLALLFAINGYREGFIASATTFIGFLGGAILGIQIAPFAADFYSEALAKLIASLLVVFALALGGMAIATSLGYRLRRRLRRDGSKRLDHLAGPIVSVAAVLLVTWVAAAPLANSSMPAVASAVRNSSLVSGIDEYMPEAVKGVYESMRESLNTSGMPDVFSGLDPTEARSVEPPDPELAASGVVVNAEDSVLKVHGSAPSCDRQIEGSSFVYDDGLVATNAHVVAGTDHVQVESDGDLYDAEVIVFEPEKDLAILSVPELDAAPLPLQSETAASGDDAIVLGYPAGGPYTATAARVREARIVTGPDIYDSGTVTREVYQLYAHIIGGNSGGPLLNPQGEVIGVIFAAAVDDPETGYALTMDESAPVLDAGRTADGPVGTGSCT